MVMGILLMSQMLFEHSKLMSKQNKWQQKVINIAKAHEVYIVLESYTYQNSKRGLVQAGKWKN